MEYFKVLSRTSNRDNTHAPVIAYCALMLQIRQLVWFKTTALKNITIDDLSVPVHLAFLHKMCCNYFKHLWIDVKM